MLHIVEEAAEYTINNHKLVYYSMLAKLGTNKQTE